MQARQYYTTNYTPSSLLIIEMAVQGLPTCPGWPWTHHVVHLSLKRMVPLPFALCLLTSALASDLCNFCLFYFLGIWDWRPVTQGISCLPPFNSLFQEVEIQPGATDHFVWHLFRWNNALSTEIAVSWLFCQFFLIFWLRLLRQGNQIIPLFNSYDIWNKSLSL